MNIAFALKLFSAKITANEITVLDSACAAQHSAARRIGSYYNITGLNGVYCSIAAGMSRFSVFIFIYQYNIIFANDPFQINAI